MIETICLGNILREAGASPYRHLVTRPTGVAVRSRIEAALDGSSCLYAHLDFSHIDLLDFSCADEIVAKLLLAARQTRYLILRGLREDQHEAVDHILTHHRLAAAALPSGTGHARLLGWTTPDSHTAFDAVREYGPIGARELADKLGWTEPRTAAALEYLAQHRVVRCDGTVYYSLVYA